MATVHHAGADLYYEVHGPNPGIDPGTARTVVFAHGRGGNAASWWQQVPHFARTRRVVVFDHRCFGRSRCAPEDFDRSLFASDLIAILDALGIEKAAIVCQSMGGWTGLGTAVQHPQRVSALVLSNTPAGIDSPEVTAALEFAKAQFAQYGVGRAALAADFGLRHPRTAYLYAQIGSLNVNLPADLLSRSGDGTSLEQLATMQTPSLFISSDQDELFPPTLIRSLADRVPNGHFTQLPGAGHSPYFETPDAFNDTVEAFLDAQALPATADR